MSLILATPYASARRVIETVALSLAVDPRDILSPARRMRVSRARQICMALLSDGFDRAGRPRSLPEVGRIFKRDHTTVLHGIRQYRRMCTIVGLPQRPIDLATHATLIALHLRLIAAAQAETFLSSRVPPVPEIEPASEPAEVPAAPSAPAETLAILPEPARPEPEPEIAIMPIAIVPPRLSNGAEFGSFDIADWRTLPEPQRRDGVLLFLERDEVERPKGVERARLERAADAFNLSVSEVKDLLAGTARHALPGEASLRNVDVLAERSIVVVVARSGADAFERFAAEHLVTKAGAAVSVSTVYAAYCAAAKAAGFDALPRSQFGFELKRFAGGAERQGDMQFGVSLEPGR